MIRDKTLIILLIFVSFSLVAQQEFREFNTNDSTEYVFNSDTTIIVSKTKIYYHTAQTLTLINDFTTEDSTMWITDFDIITDELWYVIFGDRYWGGPTILYKTVDQGITWVADTSIYNATKQAHDAGLISEEILYQLQKISVDTLLMFVSYYNSGIFYSVDSGESWNLWFANTIANYKGLFACDTAYYLWGQEGDGFRGSMFSFHKDLLISPDTNNVWTHWSGSYVYHPDCYNGVNPACIFAPNSLSGYDQFLYFENYITDNCSDIPVSTKSTRSLENPRIYPQSLTSRKLSSGVE